MKRLARPLEAVGVVAAFLALALWQAWSLEGRWTTHFLGSGEVEGWVWRYWWMKKMVTAAWVAPGATAGYAAWIAAVAGSYPETGNVFDLQVFSWPLEALLGAPLYYNVKAVLVLTLNGVAGYLLGRGLLRDRAGAAVCGLVLALSPYVLHEIANGRMRQALIFPLPLYALYLVRLWQRPSMGQAAAAGFWAGISSAVYLYYGMAAVLFTLLYVGWNTLTGVEGRLDRRRLAMGVLVLVVALSVTMPFAWSYLDLKLRGEPLGEVTWLRDFPTLAELTSPNPESVMKQSDPLLNSLQRFRDDSMPWQHAWLLTSHRSLPWLFSLLALLAVPVAWIQARRTPPDAPPVLGPAVLIPWLLGTLFFYMLILGPYLKTGPGWAYVSPETGGVATPYLWFFKYLPAFSRLFSPVRLSGMLLVCMAFLAGALVRNLLVRWSAPSFVRVLAVLAVGAVAVHSLARMGAVPMKTTQALVPEYYQRLASEPFCTLAEIPMRTGDFLQYYQTVHEKRLLPGWSDGALPPGFPEGEITKLARVPPGLHENALVRFLENVGVRPEDPGDFTEADLRFMVDRVGLRYVIVHERGCHMLSPEAGRELYQQILATLEQRFGPPMELVTEYAFERLGPSHRDPRKPAPYEYEMAVFRIGPD